MAQRHTLTWLTEAGWQAVLDTTRHHPAHLAGVKLWQLKNWPLVVRRCEPDAAPDEICLGLPLPPDADTGRKLRIPLRARAAHIARQAAPIHASDTIHAAGAWRHPMEALAGDAATMDLRVYGSLAMQSLTGLRYLTPTSDIDLLFYPRSRRQLDDGLALLGRHAAQLPLDGEIVFPDGQAVAWKEWRLAVATPASVMVKQRDSVRLADTASLLATLPE